MNIFSSGWLQRMVEKAGNTPDARIRALFLILQDWVEVPGVREQLQAMPLDEASQRALRAYLHQLAATSGVSNAEMVACQLHMVLLGALNEALRQPGAQALEHGSQAALLLLRAQLPKRQFARGGLAIAASVMLTAGLLTLMLWPLQPKPMANPPMQVATAVRAMSSPDRVSALYRLHEQIRTASCSYPQALMLAPEQRAPFIETVVDGNVGDMPPESMVMVSQLYQKVDCYYPPAAMLL
jgi:hypothetical protein